MWSFSLLSCRFRCGFFVPLQPNLSTKFLKNAVYNPKQNLHGSLCSLSSYFPSSMRGEAHHLFQALAPPRLQKTDGFRRPFSSILKVESFEGEILADVSKNGRKRSHLEVKNPNLQVDVESATLFSEEIPSSGTKPVWESEILIEDVKLLERFRSEHNWVQVLEVSRRADHSLAGARVLLLDRPGNIQSVYDPYKILTNAYYDVLASFPPILPPGPIAIYGLGGGTVANLLLHFWPGIHIHGWELDPAVISVARKYFGLTELEKDNIDRISGFESDDFSFDHMYPSTHSSSSSSSYDYLSGAPFREIDVVDEERRGFLMYQKSKLTVHIGDALGSESVVHGGFAGIIVDLFSKGAILPPLQETNTWERMKGRLRPGGRIMVNCGGSCVESESQKDGGLAMEECIATLARVFPEELCRRCLRFNGDNCIALTGPPPDLRAWMRSLPKPLLRGVFDWKAAGDRHILK